MDLRRLNDAIRSLWDRDDPTLASLAQSRDAMLAIESAAWDVTAPDWRAYNAVWHDPEKRRPYEEQCPGLAVLSTACERVVRDVRQTCPSRGMLAWHSYNMGFVIRTPSACVAIDLLCAESPALSDMIDALLLTHAHVDHVDPALVDAMLARGKPVISLFEKRGTIVDGPCTRSIAPGITAHFGIGDHHYTRPEARNDMLLCLLDAGDDGSFYHTGDNSNACKLIDNFHPDAMAFHVQVGLDTRAALERVRPRVAFGAHVLELGHPPHEYRWRYQTAIDELACAAPERAIVPIWGQRYQIRA